MKITKNGYSLPGSLAEYVAGMTAEELPELQVLIYVLAKEGELSVEDVSKDLGLSESKAECAVAFWRGAGLLSTDKRPVCRVKDTEGDAAEKKLPPSVRDTDSRSYSGTEIARIMDENPELQSLLKYAQDRLGKVFSPSDLSKLVYLADYALLSPAMIMRIIEYCVEIDKKSMRYVEKTALSIYDEGIESYEALEEYFAAKKRRSSRQGIVRSIIGIGERNFTSKEAALIDRWFDEFESSRELISLAFEKTVVSISKPSVPYMSKLLESWHQQGFSTPADVEAGKAEHSGIDLSQFDEAKGSASPEKDSSGLDLGDFFENL